MEKLKAESFAHASCSWEGSKKKSIFSRLLNKEIQCVTASEILLGRIALSIKRIYLFKSVTYNSAKKMTGIGIRQLISHGA